jgi:hypothetical protein
VATASKQGKRPGKTHGRNNGFDDTPRCDQATADAAEIDTHNSAGVSALQRSRESESDAMTQLLLQSLSANTGRTK